MRQLLLAALLTTACQPSTGGNDTAAPAGAESNVVSNLPADSPPLPAGDPNTTVSSNDPQPASPPAEAKGKCPIVRSSDWHAHVDAMPGPNDNPRLIVTGRVTVPTGGYRLDLRMGPVAESYPVQMTVYLDAVPPGGPATQALVTREVRGSWRSEQRVGSVTVRCNGEVIARLSNIETAL